jgi:hypothetical protein
MTEGEGACGIVEVVLAMTVLVIARERSDRGNRFCRFYRALCKNLYVMGASAPFLPLPK